MATADEGIVIVDDSAKVWRISTKDFLAWLVTNNMISENDHVLYPLNHICRLNNIYIYYDLD